MMLMRQDRTSGMQMTCIRLSSNGFTRMARQRDPVVTKVNVRNPSVFPLCRPLLRQCILSNKEKRWKTCRLFMLCVKVAQKVTGDKQRASTSPLVTSWGNGGGRCGGGDGGGSCPDRHRVFCCQTRVDADVDNNQFPFFLFSFFKM